MIVSMERKLFVFDIGGVVVFHPSVMDEFSAHYKLDKSEVRSDWAAYSKPIMDGFCGPEIMYRMFEHKYNLDLSNDDLMLTYYHPTVNQPMIEIIKALRRSGHRVVSGSNTYAGHWEYCKAMPERPLDCFDKLYASHEIHFSKPDAEFYQFILNSEGFAPEQAVFTDDFAVNIDSAEKLGMTTFLYTQDNKALEDFFRPYIS